MVHCGSIQEQLAHDLRQHHHAGHLKPPRADSVAHATPSTLRPKSPRMALVRSSLASQCSWSQGQNTQSASFYHSRSRHASVLNSGIDHVQIGCVGKASRLWCNPMTENSGNSESLVLVLRSHTKLEQSPIFVNYVPKWYANP